MAVATPIDNVVVRLAKPEDYEAVLDIDKTIYSGLDIIPTMYHQYLNDPDRSLFVMDVDKKVVAFTMYQFVDEGKTAVAQAARISPKSRSSGIFNHIGNQAFDMMREAHPKVIRVRLTSAYKRMILAKMMKGTWKTDLILERPFIDGYLIPGKHEAVKSLSWSPSVQKVDMKRGMSILFDPDNQWKLFPQRKIILSTEVFDLSTTNLNFIGPMCENILASFEPRSNANSCSTISLGKHYKTLVGIRYNIDVYSLDVQEAYDHIFYQLNLALQYYKEGTICFMIVLPASFPRQEMLERIHKLLPVKTDSLHNLGQSVCLFEQNLLIHSSLRAPAKL